MSKLTKSDKFKDPKYFNLWIEKSNSLVRLYTGKQSDGIIDHRRSIQCLMLMDNMHDFGKSRKNAVNDYKPDFYNIYCNADNYNEKYSCIMLIILKKLNDISLIFSIDGNNIFTKEMFKITSWEKAFREVLIQAGVGIYVMPTKMFIPTIPATINCWSKDYSKNTTSIQNQLIEKLGQTSTILLTSHLDGCGGTCGKIGWHGAVENVEKDFEFNIPLPTGDGNEIIKYKYNHYDDDGKSNGVLTRTFPKRWGKGNTKYTDKDNEYNNRLCSCGGIIDETKPCWDKTCPYKRVDTLDSKYYKKTSTIPNDTIGTLMNDFYAYINHMYPLPDGSQLLKYEQLEFFITTKCLGDFAQAAEAKARNCFFIASDGMQFIMGSKIGTKVLDSGVTKGNVVFFSETGVEGYIYNIFNVITKSGIAIPTPDIISEPEKVSRYYTINESTFISGLKNVFKISYFCLKCLLTALRYFYQSAKFIFMKVYKLYTESKKEV